MVLDRALRDAGPTGDKTGRRSGIAPLDEEIDRGIEDAKAGVC